MELGVGIIRRFAFSTPRGKMRPYLRSQAIQLFVILGIRSLCFGQFDCDRAVTLHRYALQVKATVYQPKKTLQISC